MPFLLCLLEALSCNTQADTEQNRTEQNIQQALAAHCLPAANTEGAKSELFTFLQSEENTYLCYTPKHELT